MKYSTNKYNAQVADFDIATWLTAWAEDKGLIPEEQKGFRASRGCIDNIFILNSAININLRKKMEFLSQINKRELYFSEFPLGKFTNEEVAMKRKLKNFLICMRFKLPWIRKCGPFNLIYIYLYIYIFIYICVSSRSSGRKNGFISFKFGSKIGIGKS